MKIKGKLVFMNWLDPMTDTTIVDNDTALAWLHSGCTFDAEIEIPEEEVEELAEFKQRGIVPLFRLSEVK